MKGLLIKDLILMKNQAKTLLLLAVCGIIMSLSMEPQTVIVYLSMMAGMVAMGTLSYDEMENGCAFLLTLPVTRKDYVREKYGFSLVWTVLCSGVGLALCAAVASLSGRALDGGDALLTALGAVGMITLFMSVMLPLRIKYGSEKGRIVLYVFVALIAGVVFLLSRTGGFTPPAFLDRLNLPAALWILLAVSLVCFCVSGRISRGILEKKEF